MGGGPDAPSHPEPDDKNPQVLTLSLTRTLTERRVCLCLWCRWEEGRLRASGMVTMLQADDEEDDQELRTHIVVHPLRTGPQLS